MSGLFPSIPVFEEILGSLTAEEPQNPDGWQILRITTGPALSSTGAAQMPNAIQLWYKSASSKSFEDLKKKLGFVLSELLHESNDEVVNSVLALYSIASRSRSRDFSSLLNEMLELIVPAELSQIVAIRYTGPGSVGYEVGNFRVGLLDQIQLMDQLKIARSQLPGHFYEQLSAHPLCVSQLVKTKIISWQRFTDHYIKSPDWSSNELPYRLVDQYLYSIAESHFKAFFQDFQEAQLLPQALGVPFLSFARLEKLAGSKKVSIFFNVRGQENGWVVNSILLAVLNLGKPDAIVPATINALETHYGPIQESAVDKQIKQYCRFLAQVPELRMDGRLDDAFLYNVIALDLLLGEQGSSTSSVTERSALLAHTGIGTSYEVLLRRCKKIYDARSKYVHKGIRPEEGLLEEVEVITREVLFCLLRLKATAANSDDNFFDSWIKRIDVLVAKYSAKDEISEQELQRVGVACGEDFTYIYFKQELLELISSQRK